MLYTDTALRAVALSELRHLTGKDSSNVNPFVDLAVGDVIDEATVMHTDNMLGVYFKLRDNITARAQVCFNKRLFLHSHTHTHTYVHAHSQIPAFRELHSFKTLTETGIFNYLTILYTKHNLASQATHV